jgi:hypothetical protein
MRRIIHSHVSPYGCLQSCFGVFHGRMTRVKIRFSPEAAMHIKERQWHASRETMDQPDGSIIFSTKTAGIHDIRIWVLSWGSKARVLAPESLKEMITSEIEALNRHGIPQLPHHLDGPFTLMADMIARPQK